MTKVAIKIAITIAVGVSCGVALTTTPVMMLRGAVSRITNSGSWMTTKGLGSREADPILRALVSQIGIFANSSDMAVYFSGYTRSPLKRLRGGTHYRIEGSNNIPATWWSITLYDADQFLFANAEDRYSFTNLNVKSDRSGHFEIDVSPDRPQGSQNWLPSPSEGKFTLFLRVYEPGAALRDDLSGYPLPRITEVH
jgi:hypothetical protein